MIDNARYSSIGKSEAGAPENLYEGEELSKAPSIIFDSAGHLVFCFRDGRMLVVGDTASANPSIPASAQG
jgi:hypothetical protein